MSLPITDNRKLIKKKKIKKGTCSCGKKYPRWIHTYESPDENSKEKCKKLEGNCKNFSEIIGYPENSCHCHCGEKWGEHKTIVRIDPKDKCVSCFAKINKEDYELRGNFCGTCCANADERLKKRFKKLKLKNYESNLDKTNRKVLKSKIILP